MVMRTLHHASPAADAQSLELGHIEVLEGRPEQGSSGSAGGAAPPLGGPGAAPWLFQAVAVAALVVSLVALALAWPSARPAAAPSPVATTAAPTRLTADQLYRARWAEIVNTTTALLDRHFGVTAR